MKDNRQITKKQLKALAINLEAIKLSSDVYNYENYIHYLLKSYNDIDVNACNYMIAYSAGVYGNNGRIDKIVSDNEEFYVCWY